MKKQLFYVAAISIILPIVLYSNSFNALFLFDDVFWIGNNPYIKSFSEFKTRLNYKKKAVYDFRHMEGVFVTSRPLTFLTFTLNYYWGKLNPFGYRLFNLFLHIFNILLVFLLTRKILFYFLRFEEPAILAERSPPALLQETKFNSFDDPTWNAVLPLATALFFAVHPIQTEAVTYIYHRGDSLATLFSLLSLFFFIKAVEKNKWFYVSSICCYFLALTSKEIGMTVPAILILLDYFFLSDMRVKEVIKKKFYHLPFWILLINYLAFRYWLFGIFADIQGGGQHEYWTNWTYFITHFFVILKYLKLLFIPIGQTIHHYIPAPESFFEPRIIFSLLTVILIVLVLYKIYKRYYFYKKLLLFSVLCFIITLSPTSSFFKQVEIMCERRLYLPMFGFSIFLLLLYIIIFNIRPDNADKTELNGHKLIIKFFNGPNSKLFFFLPIHLILLSGLTWTRNYKYNDHELIWLESIQQYPNSNRGYLSLGALYLDRNDYDEAFRVYRKSLELGHEHPRAYLGLGFIFHQQKKYKSALSLIQKSVELSPQFLDAYVQLGLTHYAMNNLSQAIQCFQKAIGLDPRHNLSYRHLSRLYLENQEPEQALKYSQKAAELNPYDFENWINLGNIYLAAGKYRDALETYQKSIDLNPAASFSVYQSIGNTYLFMGEYDNACNYFSKALEYNFLNIELRFNLGMAYYMQKEYKKALMHFRVALELTPNNSFIQQQVDSLQKLLNNS